MTGEPRPTIRQWLLLAVALVLLNASVTFHNLWPTVMVTTRYELSIELALLLLAFVAWSLRKPPPRAAWIALTWLLIAMAAGRYAEVTAPALYGRPVNLYWDAQHLPKVAAMLAEVASPWVLATAGLGAVMLLVALVAAFFWAVRRVEAALRVPVMRRALGALAAGVVALFAVGHLLQSPARYWFSVPVAVSYWQQARFLIEAYAADTERELPIEPLESSDLTRVAGADVLLMFLESYGATAYDRPPIAAVVQPPRAELAAAAAATGRRVVSAFVSSPTFGGASWLAHATLMSEHEVSDVGDYNLLLTQSRETLPALFAAAGYRSIAWMPGLRNAWPEGAYYGFAAIYGERELGYRGPDFGWWRIPDQFALARLDALELTQGKRAPLFVFFPTINSHIPFRPTPPYQPDWERVLGADPFSAEATAASLAQEPDWDNLAPAYADTLAYTFTYLGGYLRARPEKDLVLVLVGDHQPAASVTGLAARWDVPVHVVTSRGDIADALRAAGFIEGVELDTTAQPVGGMPELTAVLLRAFDSGGGSAPPGESGAAQTPSP